jgi:hypothetical protein
VEGASKKKGVIMALGECFDCKTPTDLLCPKCEKYFCQKHASAFNKRYCISCGPNWSLGIEPAVITSDDGKDLKGKRIKLIGEGWPNQLEKIQSLNDDDLGDKILEYKNLLKEVVRLRDTFLITVSALENEYIGRRAKKVRSSGQLASGLSFTPSVDVRPTKPTASAEDKAIANLAKAMSIDIDKARLVYMKLKGK